VCDKLIVGIRHPKLSTALYLIMGWAVLVALRPLVLSMPPQGVMWLVAGGLSYSAGVLFYNARAVPYNHFIWHLFVLAGSTCHFFSVLWYAV
jgi:hemolysin III